MSFVTSLAAVGTSVAGLAGITGLGTTAAALTGAGTLAAGGAGLGAGMAAATGGDIGEGALMGGITAPLMAPLMTAAGAAAPATQAGTQVAANVGAKAATDVAANTAIQGVNQGVIQGAAGSGLTSYGLGAAPGAFAGELTGGSLGTVAGGVSEAATPFLSTLAGKATTGAGIGALMGGVTNPDDPLKGAAIGAGAGALGGYGAGALAQGAGSSVLPAAVGEFAAAHPMITSGLISVPTAMALDSATAPDASTSPFETQKSRYRWAGPNNFRWNPTGYATGGITDLDTYMSNAQNIPNPREVSDPEGYGGSSVQMMAQGGIADLGGYATGGRPNLLNGAGDGVSDDIPASIAGKQPARLAAGEYVVPSRIVSELGNGSTDAGAKRLDQMVQKIQAGRKKTMGNKKQFANDTKPYKHLPA